MLLTVFSMFLHKKSHRFFFNTIKICTQAAQQKILIQTSRHLARSILQNIAQYVLYIMQHSGAAKFFKILKSGAGLPNSAVWSMLKPCKAPLSFGKWRYKKCTNIIILLLSLLLLLRILS